MKKNRSLQVTLTYPILARMERYCTSRDLPKAQFIRQATAFFLDALERTDSLHRDEEIPNGKVIPFPGS